MSESKEQQHSPLPWRMGHFPALDGKTRITLNAVGKSPTGRNWTAYAYSGDELVFETYGYTPEEAEANANLIIGALHVALAEKESQ